MLRSFSVRCEVVSVWVYGASGSSRTVRHASVISPDKDKAGLVVAAIVVKSGWSCWKGLVFLQWECERKNSRTFLRCDRGERLGEGTKGAFVLRASSYFSPFSS